MVWYKKRESLERAIRDMKVRLTTLLEGESGGFEFRSNCTAELDTTERVCGLPCRSATGPTGAPDPLLLAESRTLRGRVAALTGRLRAGMEDSSDRTSMAARAGCCTGCWAGCCAGAGSWGCVVVWGTGARGPVGAGAVAVAGRAIGTGWLALIASLLLLRRAGGLGAANCADVGLRGAWARGGGGESGTGDIG